MAQGLLDNERSHIEDMRLATPKLGDEPMNDAANWHYNLYRILCLPYAKQLALVLKKLNYKYFIFAFDECSYLGIQRPAVGSEPSRCPLWGMSLIALLRIIKAADTFDMDMHGIVFWYLLLDTSPSVHDLAPRGRNTPSCRLTKELNLLSPWVCLGFNHMVEPGHSQRIKTAADVLSVDHQKVYGRPYWSYLGSRHEALNAAHEKLFFNDKFDPRNEIHVFSALAFRLCLEIGEEEESTRIAVKAVRSHMRIFLGVVGSLTVTSAPSEPILAIAAAEALNTSPETYQDAIKTLLDKLILRGLVPDRGLLGELFTRLLLMIARDKAVVNSGRKFVMLDPANHVPTVQAVRVADFLQTLLGPDLGIPDNMLSKASQRQKLLSDTYEVWINFTHFVPLSKSIDEVTPSMLLEAWSSGYAFQCTFLQEVIDGFIVAYSGDLDEAFDIRNLFTIPWQTKARSKTALARQLTAPFLVEKDSHGNCLRRKPDHLVILLDLSASSALGRANGPHVDLEFEKAEHPTTKGDKWGGYARENEVEPARHCLNIRGHSSRVYPVLQEFGEPFDLLFQRSLFCVEEELAVYSERMEHDWRGLVWMNNDQRSIDNSSVIDNLMV